MCACMHTRTHAPAHAHMPRACVCVCMVIQPEAMGKETQSMEILSMLAADFEFTLQQAYHATHESTHSHMHVWNSHAAPCTKHAGTCAHARMHTGDNAVASLRNIVGASSCRLAVCGTDRTARRFLGPAAEPHVRTHTRRHARSQLRRMHISTQTSNHACMPNASTHAMHTAIYPFTHARTHAPARTRTHPHAPKCTQVHPSAPKCPRTNTHTRSHAFIHAASKCMHACTHAHTDWQ